MGQIHNQRPVLLIAAVSSRYQAAIDDWTRGVMENNWGSIAIESPMFVFDQTSYYTPTMGTDLKKKLFAFKNLIDPANLVDSKILSNRWEDEFLRNNRFPEKRPLNIDPGYISEAKVVLATTKDRDHRLYLRDGIFAEVTLHFKKGGWESSRWTYPDYQSDHFHEFFTRCRDYLRQRYLE